MAKIIFFLIDGLADPINNKTPLKSALKINIEKLLKKSFLAQFYPLKKENWPPYASSSATGLANLGILGYELKPNQVKRGPLEAFALGLFKEKENLALRVDLATVNKNLVVIDRRAGREIFGFEDLEKDINSLPFPVSFSFHRTYGHRGVLIFKKRLSDHIDDSDPYKTGKKVKKIKPLKKDPLSKKTAKIVQEFLTKSFFLLDNHNINILRQKKGMLKANYLLTREAGNKLPNLKNFFQKYNFKNGLVIAENGVVKAGCLLAGFKSLTLPEIKNLEERYNFLKKAIVTNYQSFDLTYIHLKESDEASHDKDHERKRKYFEFFDKWLGNILKNLSKETIFIITGDHITDTKTGKHLYGPLPILIINYKNPNQPKEFSELEAQKTKIKLKPQDLWQMIK